jgi:hypothetical protein
MAAKKTISLEKAKKELTELRKGRGGRKSKYQDILDELENMGKNEVYPHEVEGYSSVSTLRNAVERVYGDRFVVVSSKIKEDTDKDKEEATYRAYIIHEEAAAEI